MDDRGLCHNGWDFLFSKCWLCIALHLFWWLAHFLLLWNIIVSHNFYCFLQIQKIKMSRFPAMSENEDETLLHGDGSSGVSCVEWISFYFFRFFIIIFAACSSSVNRERSNRRWERGEKLNPFFVPVICFIFCLISLYSFLRHIAW